MRARTFLRVGAAGCLVVVAGTGWAAFAPQAGAVGNVQSGFWSSYPAAPQVPAGGLEVSSNVNGPAAVAAIRFTLDSGESAPVLKLKVAQAQPQSQVAVQACQVAAKSSSWQPPSGGGPGKLADAPAADCSAGLVIGQLASDGSTLTFDFSTVGITGSTVDIVIQPNQVANPAGALPSQPSSVWPTFDVALQPVTSAEITVGQAASGSSTGSGVPSSSGNPPVPAPQPPPAAAPVVQLPASTTSDAGVGSAPVVAASPQSSPVAQAAPALLTKKRNMRLLFGIGMLSSDVLFLLLWMQHRMPSDERPALSIYDPPPVTS